MKCITVLLFCLTVNHLAAQDGDQVLGYWLNEEKDAKIEVYKTGTSYFGKLVWGKNFTLPDGSQRKDDNNPDKELRNRLLLNTVIVKDLRYNGKEWTGGNIYDPKSGNSYSCNMRLEGNTLHLRGYKGISLLGRTTVWTRAE